MYISKFEYFFILNTIKMANPFVTTSGIEIHDPKLILQVGKTTTGKERRMWRLEGQAVGSDGEKMIKKSIIISADTAKEYGGEKKAVKKTMATPKPRKSCKAKAKDYEEKCEAKKKKSSPKKAAKKKAPKKEESEEPSEEEEKIREESSSSEELPEEEPESSSEESPKKKSPAKKAAKKAAKKPAKKAAKKPAKKAAKKVAKK